MAELGVATGGYWQDYVTTNEDDSTYQKIVNAVGVRLAGILTATGWKTDLGAHVFLWRPTPLDPDTELPGIIYRDISNAPEEVAIGTFRWRLHFELKIVCQEGATTPTEARKMIEDVVRAIGWSDSSVKGETWGGLAQETDQPTIELDVNQAENIIAGVNISFDVIYETGQWEI